MITKVTALKDAKARIAPEQAWTTETWARDEDGIPIDVDNFYAKCWCAVGSVKVTCALYHLSTGQEDEIRSLLDRAAKEVSNGVHPGIIDLNDDGGHDLVLQAFDRAIELAGLTP